MTLASLSGAVRAPGDPRIQESGPSSLTGADSVAKALGWFSIALGVAELVAPGRIAQAVGLDGKHALVRSYGARELVAGVQTLSVDKPAGLASRVIGDLIDIATLVPALSSSNPKRGNAVLALGAVAAITILDYMAYASVSTMHARSRGETRDYRDRSGFPRGVESSRGLARARRTLPQGTAAGGASAEPNAAAYPRAMRSANRA
jgi:hypothetical protein